MAISLNGRTKPTSDAERAFIELGGADPHSTLTEGELSEALVNAINQLVEVKSPILEKLYMSISSQDATLPSLEELRRESSQDVSDSQQIL